MYRALQRRKTQAFYCLALCCLLCLASAEAQQEQTIPHLGDPTAAVLPLSYEQRLGKLFTMKLRSVLPIIHDIELNEYLSALGKELVAAMPTTSLQYHFLLTQIPQVNAFATIGGVITMNSGLILETSNESQLAAVLAHEIGHVSNRHIARSLAVQHDLRWANALALLGTIVASTYDPELAKVGMQTLSLPIERQLAYSRHFEFEADQFGLRLLDIAKIDPAGMAQFFSLLNSLHSDGHTPEFLRTHPLTTNRIANATNYTKRSKKTYRSTSEEFQFAHARLYALLNPIHAVKTNTHDWLGRYQKAIALNKLHKPQQAIQTLSATQATLDQLPIQLALAQAQLLAGHYTDAERTLRDIRRLYPQRESIHYYLARALMQQNKLLQAYNTLKPFANSFLYPIIDKQLAEIAFKQQKEAIAYEFLADFYRNTGHFKTALNQLDRAEKIKPQSPVLLSRVRAKRESIQGLQKEIKNPLPN